ncbi:hypothetical protein CWO91_11270 [Bradyrhizobium genosp. SA-3]|nr:hypothetical protein CWO91_11270 [Bradyrhizobium genosp. SA-3]
MYLEDLRLNSPRKSPAPKKVEPEATLGTSMETLIDYHAYTIGDEGHINMRIDLRCESDAAARERARRLVDGHAVELWRGDQLLDRFEPEAKQ